jgi:transposase-like protein
MTTLPDETVPPSPQPLLRIDETKIRGHLDEMVRSTVEQTLNDLLDAEAETLCGAKPYERSEARKALRSGHYERELETKAGAVTLKVPKLKGARFETAIIERYRRRESSVEEALVEMYLAGVSVRRVEDITEALWGTRVSASTVSELNQKIYGRLDAWRNRPIDGAHPYVYLDGLWLKRCWGEEVRNVSVLVAIAVNQDGMREVIGVAEGMKEDKSSWLDFLRWLKGRGLNGTRLFISDCCLGLVEALGECFPHAAWQRCIVHFYRNVFSTVPSTRVKEVAAMLKAIHAQEDADATRQKATEITAKLMAMRLTRAAELVRDAIEDTLAYLVFPREHWRRIRTNNPLERLNREIRRRTRVVGAFPDGNSAVMLISARLRHVAGTAWGTKRYLNLDHLNALEGTTTTTLTTTA